MTDIDKLRQMLDKISQQDGILILNMLRDIADKAWDHGYQMGSTRPVERWQRVVEDPLTLKRIWMKEMKLLD